MPNAKIFGVRLRTGDAYLMHSGGGGGFGDPLERDAAQVALDVREDYVSVEAARNDYGVIVTDHGKLDAAATARLRRQRLGQDGEDNAFEVIAG